MALGVNLGDAGVPGCDFQAVGETEDDVMAAARDHLGSEHPQSMNDDVLNVIRSLIGPIPKD